jgi:tRNA threonylcarbamoyl adenosine modification protein YjeE
MVQQETAEFGRKLSEYLKVGDVVTLTGDLGAGKSTLARSIVRQLVGDESIDVPSPTFTLIQYYTAVGNIEICHADLYRLQDEDEIYDLGFDDMKDNAIFLVEWPEKLPDDWQEEALHIFLKSEAGSSAEEIREIQIAGSALWAKRLSFLNEEKSIDA